MADKPAQDLDKEGAEFYKKDLENIAKELQEAVHIKNAPELMTDYLKKGIITMDEPVIKALEKMEKRQLELAGVDPEDAEDEDDEEEEK